MNLLLDTHVLLWWLGNNPTLSAQARKVIGEGESRVYVSAATVWEIVIKKNIAKLDAPRNLEEELARHRFETLPVTLEHALALDGLPMHHSDPFDRILIAQARYEHLTLITRDRNIVRYDVPVIRA